MKPLALSPGTPWRRSSLSPGTPWRRSSLSPGTPWRRSSLCVAIALLLPAVVYAGQIYGTIIMDGQGVKSAALEIQCGKDEPVKGTTAADGSYRVNVPQQGQCTLTLPSYAGTSAAIFSGPNPAAYNYELVKGANGKFELKRR